MQALEGLTEQDIRDVEMWVMGKDRGMRGFGLRDAMKPQLGLTVPCYESGSGSMDPFILSGHELGPQGGPVGWLLRHRLPLA